jgi:short-subunit dehydrogenase
MALPKPRPDAVALVTGASSGIGDALARELRSRGYPLVVVARREERLQKLADELGETHVVACDLADEAERAKLVERVSELGLEVDILVNNAGFATGGPYAESDPDKELAQVRILVEAPVALTSAFLPAMARRRSGGILNVASTAGLGALPHSAGYSAAKHHTRVFSESLHHELRGRGVAVTALCPGPVTTELWEVEPDHPIEAAVPKQLWVDAERCATEAVDGLEANRRIVVPGLALRAGFAALQYVPSSLKLPLTERVLRQ